MKNQAHLIAYVDRLPGGTFRDLRQLLNGPLNGVFGGVHVLPFFHPIDGADAGFDPIDHTLVDPRVGTWADVAALAADTDVIADLIVNHVSRRSPRFLDFDARGPDSRYAGMFLTCSRVFGESVRESDLLALHTIRPELPFTIHDSAHGRRLLLWTTFTRDQILHTLYTENAAALRRWLSIRPTNAITVLDTHDGIGVQDVGRDRRRPDTDQLLPQSAIDALIDTIDRRSGGESRHASGATASNVDASQINCTFYDALGRRDHEYLIARAIQCFVPGIPQIYYIGLLAGTNDMDLLRRTQVGRDINRRYYTATDLQQALARPVVRSLLDLLRLRNTHPAFGGRFEVLATPSHRLALSWTQDGDAVTLDVDLAAMTATIAASGATGTSATWRTPLTVDA